ncbi:MAG: methyltransferase domain-containing protein [Nanoarchaeota archaeon]|nr:methyltransferase domain-containing protein [Nanoarchaeota archaeon]
MRFAIICAVGTEKIALEEISSIASISAIEILPGVAFFEAEDDADFSMARTVEDIMVLVKRLSGISRHRASLRAIRHQAAKIPLKYLSIKLSVKASYTGRRDYTAKDVEAEFIKGVSTRIDGKTATERHFSIILNEKNSFIGVSVHPMPLHVERSMPKTSAGSLRPSIACAMLRQLGDINGKSMVDLMAGAGTIPIEASIMGCRSEGYDIDEEKIGIAKSNAMHFSRDVIFRKADARDTGLPAKSFDFAVSNLPFEKQVAIGDDPALFFQQVLAEMSRIAREKIVVLTRHQDIINQVAGDRVLSVHAIQNSGVGSEIIVMRP